VEFSLKNGLKRAGRLSGGKSYRDAAADRVAARQTHGRAPL